MPASPPRLATLAVGALVGASLVPLGAHLASAATDASPACIQAVAPGPVTCTFAFTGASEDWAVPQGATSVTVTAVGGHGSATDQASAALGGRGGIAVGTYAVQPGDELTVTVAGDGGVPQGGFGYGNGGTANVLNLGAGGGGGSAVASSSGGLLLVAGGGGGGGLRSGCTIGGDGGDAGQEGQPGGDCLGVAGGVGGTAGASGTTDGTSTPPGSDEGGGGAGGGGYHGGLAGQGVFNAPGANFTGAGGGGGGTSFANPSGTALSTSGTSSRGYGANGQVTISYVPGGPATGLDLAPASSVVHAGDGVTYTVTTINGDGFGIADVSSQTALSIEPDGTCTGETCTPAGPGTHTVTAHYGTAPDELTAMVTLAVTQVPAFTNSSDADFVVGEEGTFTVAAAGVPTPTIAVESGTLPTGLSFVDNGDGTATLSGTVVAPRGTSDLTLQASSSEGQAHQTLHVHVQSVPAFFGPDTLTYVLGEQGSDQVLTDATPDATLSVTQGTVPPGLTFTDNGDGTATLQGTPTGPPGPVLLTVSAANAAGTTTHDYLIRIASVPIFTSPDHVTLRAGRASSFRVSASGYPSPEIRLNGSTLPSGLQLVEQGDGRATIEGTPQRATSVTVMLQAGNVAGSVNQDLALTISPRLGSCANRQRGTNGRDRLLGTGAGDRLRGLGGRDVLRGLGGADCLGGGHGADVLRGGRGRDLVSGNAGPDVLVGGRGIDKVRGGRGADVIRVRDGRRDLVWCGPGRDRVIADRRDVTVGCERMLLPRR